MKNEAFINKYLKDTLSEGRYQHSVSTAETCRRLAVMFGYDPDRAFFTGLVHDIAREFKGRELIGIASRDGDPVNDEETKYPVLLHGRAGAVILKEKFSIDDSEILHAIQVHTTGAAGMGILDKILFVADYIEPKRRHITPEFMAELEGKTLDQMVYIVLRSTLDYLAGKGKDVAGPAEDLLKEFESV
ncbi:MAG: bis(5'-nucleosyl)-tetraphosphatase (symmetrical) YqeK [Spirochaetia bacterium]|nr:bis(5'-nucleosyl)-tetraphosphatase (symmetrical) YqeK [Spirochaetia bacterium]